MKYKVKSTREWARDNQEVGRSKGEEARHRQFCLAEYVWTFGNKR